MVLKGVGNESSSGFEERNALFSPADSLHLTPGNLKKPTELVESIMLEGIRRSEEMIELGEHVFAKQESATCSLRRKQSLQARYVYGFIFFTTNLMAWLVRDYGHKVLTIFQYITVCGMEGDGCYHSGGVLRVSLGCFIFFTFMFLTTFRASKLEEARNSWHSRWWPLKLVLYLLSMLVPFIIPFGAIQLYGEIARVGAGIFLLLQLISVIHLITWCNNQWMPDSQSKQCGFLGLFFSTISYIASFCGIVLMYINYAPNLSCSINIFYITWTAILVKVMMVVSLHSKVNTGLLSSGIMGSYIVFLCWSAIQSEPPVEQCNKQMKMAENGDWTAVLSFLIGICAIVMATFSTGIDSKSFQFRKHEVQSEDGVPYKYDFFHFIFSMGAMYFAMLFISWELDHPMRKWSIDVGWASTWVKIINEWFAASLYLWKLISPVIMKDGAMDHEEPAQPVHESV